MRTIRTLLAFLVLAIPAALFGQVSVSVSIGPPALPVYEQPICPGDGYLWIPGYWAYDDSVSDYYWVPGTWVQPPEEGFLWTPGYWGWRDGGFFFNDGYWGPEVGFYGGINYGFGYFGEGYDGGRWDNGHFYYNRSVNNVDVERIHNVYDKKIDNRNESRVSFNGGSGGIEVRATAEQEATANQRHVTPVAAQTEHARIARTTPELRASANHGNPPIAATSKPGEFSKQGAAAPQQAAETSRSTERGAATENHAAVHPKDLAPIARPAPVNSGNAKADKKYEQQQDKLIAQQTQERQQLQQKQDTEHQQKTNANTQKLEQKHQQQAQVLQQRHTSQQQSLQARQPHASQPQSHESGSAPRK